MTTLRAGFAKALITPKVGVAMAGYAARTGRAKGVHDDLYAHVMILEESSTKVAVVNLDLVEVSSRLVEELQRRIGDIVKIPRQNIMICATHTHSGPLVSERFGEAQQSETMSRIIMGSIKAIEEAKASMQNVQVKCSKRTIYGIAKNRRSLEETADPSLQIVGFYAGENLLGCLVNFALHATVLGAENLLYSADYPGYIRKSVVKLNPGCHTLVLNGAAGNVNIGYSADASALGEKIYFRTFEKAEEVGSVIAEVALKALEEGPIMEQVQICVGTQEAKLPLKELPSIGELEGQISKVQQEIGQFDPESIDERKLSIKKVYLECVRDVIQRFGIQGESELSMSLQALSIGDVVLVAIPGELFAEIGLAIKEGWVGKQVMVVGYANGSFGYLPTAEAYLQGGYETETSVFAPAMGDVLVREARDLIQNLSNQERK